jgi:LmbE family N-acetylglucosaminyl deacetylase
MAVLAHPDDESMATGGALARYAAEGIETYLVMATRGERGWFGEPGAYPGPEALGRLREAELHAAAEVLGLREVTFLDYVDGDLDRAEPAGAIGKIVAHLRRVRPQVIITFDPNGMYGHPDHIAIAQFATAAMVAAADASYSGYGAELPPHRVSKLYYRSFRAAEAAAYQAAFGDLVMRVDGAERRLIPWPDWAISTRIDTSAHWQQVWHAITCHRSQLPGYQALQALPNEAHENLWGTQTYYRALSLVNGGREVERDLFAGLREPVGLLLPVNLRVSSMV